MGMKVSTALTKAMDSLKEFAGDQLKNPEPINVVKVNDDQFKTLVENYETTLSNGDSRGITLSDVEAVGNFQRDLHTAGRVIAGDVGAAFLGENEDQDSLKVTFQLPEVAGHGLTITSAFYRPGKEEETSQDYTAVTRSWTSSEDDKAVDEHLAGLTKSLLKKKK